MMHNSLGEIVTPPFEIDIYQSGFEQLYRVTHETQARTQSQVVFGWDGNHGHYFENLARHLVASSQPITLLNSYAVKENRQQHMMRRDKADTIDVAAMGDLLRRGEGTPYQPSSRVYLQLQHIDQVHLGKVKIERILKNQIVGRLDHVFPGLIREKAGRERYTPLLVQ